MGGDHSPANLRLVCPAHNAYLAQHDYGPGAIARYRRSMPVPGTLGGASTSHALRPGRSSPE
jgi:hypothetical protein